MWLEVSSEGQPTRSLQLGDATITVGRADDCELVVDDAFVSHHHARIDARTDGVWITDLGSRNGTFVNGELLVTARRLDGGSEVRIGSTILRIATPPPVENKKTEPRKVSYRQRSVLYLEPSHAGAAIGSAIFAVLFGLMALTALAYTTSAWPDSWRPNPDIPEEAPVIVAAVLGGFALLLILGAALSGRRWYIARAIERVSDDPLLASIHPDAHPVATAPRAVATAIPALEVRFVTPRTLPRLKRCLGVTATANIAGRPPLEIAYLRLFDNRPRTRTFIEGAWREFGSVWLLRSSQSVTPAEYRATMRGGGLAQLFISTPDQLHAALSADDSPHPRGREVFRNVGTDKIRVRDRYGGYPVHAMLVHGSFWKEAVDALLGQVDLVALDLSGFRPSNLGTGYELQRVVDRFPIDRLVLLADERSDQPFLEEQIRDAWSTMAAGSPNAVGGSQQALVAITDHFVKSTTTHQDGSTSETVRLDADRSQGRRVLVMAQARLEESRV